MAKPFAAFDVDGTIFKSSLLEIVVDACLRDGLFYAKHFCTVFTLKRSWQRTNTEQSYVRYLNELVSQVIAAMMSVEAERFSEIINRTVCEHQVRRFGFPRQLIKQLRSTHYLMAVSGSPTMLVEPFLRDLQLDGVYGSSYEAGLPVTLCPLAIRASF